MVWPATRTMSPAKLTPKPMWSPAFSRNEVSFCWNSQSLARRGRQNHQHHAAREPPQRYVSTHRTKVLRSGRAVNLGANAR
jgi:hypothetical protein